MLNSILNNLNIFHDNMKICFFVKFTLKIVYCLSNHLEIYYHFLLEPSGGGSPWADLRSV